MKTMLRFAGGLLLLSSLFSPALNAYLNVAGSGTAPVTWATAPTNAIFYRPTGDYFFGSPAATAYSVSYANYRTVNTAPTVTAIGSDAALVGGLVNNTGCPFNNLAVIPYSGDVTSPTIAAVATGSTSTLRFITKSNNTVVSSDPLLDVAGAALQITSAISGIRALCASKGTNTNGTDIVFAAVGTSASGANDNWGTAQGAGGVTGSATCGIQAVLVGRNTTTGAPTVIGYNLNTGGTASRATPADLTYTGSFVIGNVGLASATLTSASSTTGGYAPAMHYDEILNRLYIGITGAVASSASATGRNGLITVGIFPVTKTATTISVSGGAAPATQLAPFTAAGAGNKYLAAGSAAIPADGSGIIAIQPNAQTACTGAARILRTMHTSTGFCYLLVNGSTSTGTNANAVAALTANLVYAVPLVGPAATTAAAVGTFADVRTGDHLTQADVGIAGSLITTASAAACVGGGLGLIGAPVSTAFNNITDMWVDGDAVYVAAGTTAQIATLVDSPGVWKSQAMFDDLGKIDHWTDWELVVPTDMGAATTGLDGRVTFAAVDAYTGHVWATYNTTTNVTQWSAPATPTSQPGLAAAVNTALSNACYSVLDLNASVSGWGATTSARMTAFGGQEKVCFAITGSCATPNATLNGTFAGSTGAKMFVQLNDSVFDYTSSGSFLTTSLPAGAGAVVALGFSGWNNAAGTAGFFFAGTAGTATTSPGLYVWAATTGGAGFNPIAVNNDLQQAPFNSTFSWQKVTNVSGMPIKICANGGAVHVLTRTATLDRVYTCPVSTSLTTLNTNFIVTASTGTAPGLASVSQIYDLVISASATPGVAAAEQLVILTSDGIYTSSASIGMQSTAITQTNAGWSRIAAPTTQGLFSDYITGPLYNRAPQTFWFANFAANPSLAQSIFNKNIMYQMNRASLIPATNSVTTYANDPNTTATFNGATSFNQTTAPTIYKNFPVMYRMFYDDGARRFFIIKKSTDDTKYSILVLPYNLYDYNITADGKAVMSDTLVAQAGTFYWMSPIGATGRLAMSTDKGLILLQ